jgi:hypothetical protein
MNLPVAIPSYKRSTSISQKTLAFLASVGYPADKINIFVADTSEEELYRKAVPKELYGKIIVGVPGLAEQRNFITAFYPEGEILLGIDDDIRKIDCPYKGFSEIVSDAVKLLEDGKGGLFGIMPNDDKRKYKDDTTSHLSHIIGSFFICRNHQDILVTHTEKDDYERTILYFKRYGAVFRYRGAGVSTSYCGGNGGLQQEGRSERMLEGVLNLVSRYPGLCKRKDKNGMPDVTLNWRQK